MSGGTFGNQGGPSMGGKSSGSMSPQADQMAAQQQFFNSGNQATNIGQQGPGLNQQNPGTTGASALNTGAAGLNQNFGTSGGKSSGIFDNKQYIAPGSNRPGFNVIDPTTANDPSGMAYDASTPQNMYQNLFLSDVMIQQPDGTFRSPQELGLQMSSPVDRGPAPALIDDYQGPPLPSMLPDQNLGRMSPEIMPVGGFQPGTAPAPQPQVAAQSRPSASPFNPATPPSPKVAAQPRPSPFRPATPQQQQARMAQQPRQMPLRAPTPQQLQARQPAVPPMRRPSVQPPMLPSRPQPRRR